jgi:hypothetical protein
MGVYRVVERCGYLGFWFIKWKINVRYSIVIGSQYVDSLIYDRKEADELCEKWNNLAAAERFRVFQDMNNKFHICEKTHDIRYTGDFDDENGVSYRRYMGYDFSKIGYNKDGYTTISEVCEALYELREDYKKDLEEMEIKRIYNENSCKGVPIKCVKE